MMKIHYLKQGTPEWIEHRKNIFNASDAPAMMGHSKYKTRDQLLHEAATGEVKEVSDFVQNQVFGKIGHGSEALAWPLAEMRIGDDLSPVIGSTEDYGLSKPLGASFDGLTMDYAVAFEHKAMNDVLRAVDDVFSLPLMYKIQMEQQLMVSGGSRVLFMATKWNGEELVESKEFWYEANLDLRNLIVFGWKQFEADLAAYKSGNYVIEAEFKTVEAAPVHALPALFIKTEGKIAITNNLTKFGDAMKKYISELNQNPETDEDFANAKKSVSVLEQAESELKAAKQSALGQISSVDDVMRLADVLIEIAATNRIAQKKMVAEREKTIKQEKLQRAKGDLSDHCAKLEAELDGLRLPAIPADFVEAGKNKRNLASLQSALNDELARAKASANEVALLIRTNQAYFNEVAKGRLSLFPDLQAIIIKALDDFSNEVKARIARDDKENEERIERMRAEERERAEANVRAEAEAKSKAEADAKLKAEREAEAIKVQDIAKASPKPLEPVKTPESAVVDSEKVVAAFLATFPDKVTGKTKATIRAYLVEFVKFQNGWKG
jgi:predicted phage-related endonuclease